MPFHLRLRGSPCAPLAALPLLHEGGANLLSRGIEPWPRWRTRAVPSRPPPTVRCRPLRQPISVRTPALYFDPDRIDPIPRLAIGAWARHRGLPQQEVSRSCMKWVAWGRGGVGWGGVGELALSYRTTGTVSSRERALRTASPARGDPMGVTLLSLARRPCRGRRRGLSGLCSGGSGQRGASRPGRSRALV